MPRRESPEFERRSRRSSGERTGRPAKPFVKGSRPQRRDDSDRQDRPGRSSRGTRDGDRERRPSRSFDRDRAPRAPRDGDRERRPSRSFDRDRAPRGPRRDDRDRAPDTRTDAQRRSDDVKRKTGGRRYGKDPYPPARHTRERWQDEGSTRKPSGGRNSKRVARSYSKRDDDDDRLMTVSVKNVAVGDANKIKEQLGATAERAIERLARALHAFEAHRYAESRKLIMPLLSQVVGLAVVHEVAGLSMYRLGRWQDAADQLEIARGIKPAEVVNHPVLADCYRALRRYEKVTELWESMKLLSPPAALLAEGRIVAAGALADQGELQSAVRMMTHGTSDPHKVQEHHLREWYVLADLYDRAGDVASARRLFLKIQKSDAKFADVADRLNILGE